MSVRTLRNLLPSQTGAKHRPRSNGRVPTYLSTTPASQAAMADRQYDERWTEIWRAGLGSGERFDASNAAPSLVKLIEDNKLHVKGQHVFIPGCGRGYDVVEFAKQGAASATGMELVPEAVVAAQQYVQHSQLTPEQLSIAEVITGDFFKVPDTPQYDVGYDYTFFCAMDPAVRGEWGRAWSQWLKPGSTLVTLMFPVEPEGREGPPWPVSVDLYLQHLDPHGFKQKYLEQVLPEQCHKGREGKTWMGVWTLP